MVAADYSEGRDPTKHSTLLVRHLKMLEARPEFQRSHLVVCPESNMRFQALNLGREAKNAFPGNGVVVLEERRFDVGVRTDHLSKEAMAEGINDDLRRGALHIWEHFLSARALELAEEHNTQGRFASSSVSESDFRVISLDDVRSEFSTEMENFKRKVEPPKDPTREPKVTYSGKEGGGFDDMVMALLVANFSSKLFYDNEAYEPYH
ncbi:MAG: hypothetical protein LC650_04130 [Actinobacteria bacterium]|nr:hypothetical protein [Actinomycetota bacterium]